LRFEAIGYNPLEVEVKLNRRSKAKLKFVIEIATWFNNDNAPATNQYAFR